MQKKVDSELSPLPRLMALRANQLEISKNSVKVKLELPNYSLMTA